MGEIVCKFRAGLADFDEDSRICTPKPLKGEIIVKPSEEADGFYDFQWKPIEKVTTGNVEPIELILIPGETKWLTIKSSKSGRIFCLVFSSGEKYFFWLQDKNEGASSLNELSKADKEIVAKLEGILKAEEEEVSTGANNEDINMEDEQKQSSEISNQPIGHVCDFLTKSVVIKYVQSLAEDSPQLEALLQHLPESESRNKEALIECLRGPFFFHAADTLSKSLQESFEAGLTIANGFGYEYCDNGVLGLIKGARKEGLKEAKSQSKSKDKDI